MLMSLPGIVVLIAVIAAFGTSVWISMPVFGLLMSPGFFRLTRTSVRAVRGELYVDAARVAGLSSARIIGRHILFVVRAPIIIQASIVCGIAISIQAGLEFLGLGDPLTPAWGEMLDEGFANIYNHPILTVWPGISIALAVGAFVVLGNALRDALEDLPRIRRTKKAAVPPVEVVPAARSVAIASEHLLSVSDLRVAYLRADGGLNEVVSSVSLHLDHGEVLGLVGESGSGKTQTAFSILGLLPKEAQISGGTIGFDGMPLITQGNDSGSAIAGLRGKRIAYIPQEPMSNLDPNFTIGYQLVRPMVKLLGISRKAAQTRALDLLSERGDRKSRTHFQGISPPGIGRHGTARTHRGRSQLRARLNCRGRTDDRARCHSAGRGPRFAS